MIQESFRKDKQNKQTNKKLHVSFLRRTNLEKEEGKTGQMLSRQRNPLLEATTCKIVMILDKC